MICNSRTSGVHRSDRHLARPRRRAAGSSDAADKPGRTKYQYVTKLTHGQLAFLEWTAGSPTAWVRDGADSYVIHDGKIFAQTIHYTVERPRDDSLSEVHT